MREKFKDYLDYLEQHCQEQSQQDALLYFLEYASPSNVYLFFHLHGSTQKGLPLSPEIPQKISEFYDLVPQHIISRVLSMKKDEISDEMLHKHTKEEEDNYAKSARAVRDLLSLVEYDTPWGALFEARYNYSHPFAAISEINPQLANALYTDVSDLPHDGVHSLRAVKTTFQSPQHRFGKDLANVQYKQDGRGLESAESRVAPYGELVATKNIDWKLTARLSEGIGVKQHYQGEVEPKATYCIIDIDRLIMESETKFKPYKQWGALCEDVYKKLHTLLYAQKRKTIEIEVYFHGTKLLASSYSSGITHPKEVMAVVFAEISKCVGILRHEYRIYQTGDTLPFAKKTLLEEKPKGSHWIFLDDKHFWETHRQAHQSDAVSVFKQ